MEKRDEMTRCVVPVVACEWFKVAVVRLGRFTQLVFFPSGSAGAERVTLMKLMAFADEMDSLEGVSVLYVDRLNRRVVLVLHEEGGRWPELTEAAADAVSGVWAVDVSVGREDVEMPLSVWGGDDF